MEKYLELQDENFIFKNKKKQMIKLCGNCEKILEENQYIFSNEVEKIKDFYNIIITNLQKENRVLIEKNKNLLTTNMKLQKNFEEQEFTKKRKFFKIIVIYFLDIQLEKEKGVTKNYLINQFFWEKFRNITIDLQKIRQLIKNEEITEFTKIEFRTFFDYQYKNKILELQNPMQMSKFRQRKKQKIDNITNLVNNDNNFIENFDENINNNNNHKENKKIEELLKKIHELEKNNSYLNNEIDLICKGIVNIKEYTESRRKVYNKIEISNCIDEYIKLFLNKNTKKNNRQVLYHFLEFIPENTRINEKLIKDYLINNNYNTLDSRKNAYYILIKFLRIRLNIEITKLDINKITETSISHSKMSFTEEERENILNELKDNSSTNIFLRLLFKTGISPGKLLDLEWKNIIVKDDKAFILLDGNVTNIKFDKMWEINDNTAFELLKKQKKNKTNEKVFDDSYFWINMYFKKILKKLNFDTKKYSLYSIRKSTEILGLKEKIHTFGNGILQNNGKMLLKHYVDENVKVILNIEEEDIQLNK